MFSNETSKPSERSKYYKAIANKLFGYWYFAVKHENAKCGSY